MFLLNSRSHQFIATPSPSARRRIRLAGRTLSRSYGTNLPSSFSRVLSSALEYSSRPPVSVCGTVNLELKLRGFSWKQSICSFPLRRAVVVASRLSHADLPTRHAYSLKPGQPTPGLHNFLRPHIASWRGTGILTCFPSATPFGLALGADSPCADERGAGNLGLTACGLFTRINATHVSSRTSDTSREPYDSPSQAYGTLLYHHMACATDPQLRQIA